MCYESYFLADRFQQITTNEMTDSTVLNLIFYNFSKPVESWGQQSSTESSDAEKKMVVKVLKSPKGRKRKMKQSKIEIHGEKKKLVVKLPASDSSYPGSGAKCSSSPVVIDLDSGDSAKSCHSSECKLESSPPGAPVKKHKVKKDLKPKKEEKTKKEEQPKKEGKTKSNGKIRTETQNGCEHREETLNEFLKKKDVKKRHYLVDVISQEDCEAIDILLRQRHDEEEEARIKEQEVLDKKLVIKEEKQTDGSCDRTTDVTDATDDEDRKSKKKIRSELSTEFIVFVGPEKRKMKLVAVSDTDSGFMQSEDNTND